MYYFVKGFLWILSLLPMPLLYLLSDGMHVILYYVVRYRRDIVFENLTKAFPEKSLQEIKKIEKGFYKYLPDVMVETLKSLSASYAFLRKRMIYKNQELIDHSFAQKKSVVVVALHKANWEWNSIYAKIIPDTHVATFYHPLHNQIADRIMVEARSRFGTHQLTPSLGFKKALEWRKNPDKNFLIYMLADQSPTSDTKWCWTTFFNQDTPFMVGPEIIKNKLNLDIYFLDHVPTSKRGFYEGVIHPVDLTKLNTQSEFPLTEAFARFCEKVITEHPACYLWSHRRWKHTKPTP